MTNKTPIEDELDPNEQVIKKGLFDWIEICFGFIWFMRRVLVGIVLLAALGYWIYTVGMKPPETYDGSSVSVATETDKIDELPTASIDLTPFVDDSGDGADEPRVRTFENIEVPKKEVVSYDPLAESDAVDELIAAILGLRNSWAGKDEPVILLVNERRAKLARRLMELEIDEQQRIFALSEYIESVIILDHVLCRERLRSPEVRLAIEEIVERYRGHDVPVISAKSSLAFVLIPLHDYSRDQDLGFLDEFLRRVDQAADQIFKDEAASGRLGTMVLWLRKNQDWDGTGLQYCTGVVEK